MKLEYKFKRPSDDSLPLKYIVVLLKRRSRKICKVKGFTPLKANELTLDDFESLLKRDTVMHLSHRKWFRSITADPTLLMSQSPYDLIQTDNKRDLIFDNNNIAIDTKALHIKRPHPKPPLKAHGEAAEPEALAR